MSKNNCKWLLLKPCNTGLVTLTFVECNEINFFYLFRELLINSTTGKLYDEGSVIYNPKLGHTLKRIAADPHTFYNGTLSCDIVKEVQAAGGIITKEDLKLYKPIVKEALRADLPHSNLVVYGVPPPSSGAVVAFILRVLDGETDLYVYWWTWRADSINFDVNRL